MPEQMPLSLVVAWLLIFGFVNTHQRHARGFHGASQAFSLALNVSTLLGSLCMLVLFGYYFYVATWYWPIVLFVLTTLGGGFFFAYLDFKIGEPWMSLLGFVVWPSAALWLFFIIKSLPT